MARTVDIVLHRPGSVATVRPLAGGASRRSWLVELEPAAGHRPDTAEPTRLVVQAAVPGGTTIGSMVVEGRLVAAAARAEVPVPPVIGSGEDGPLGGPYLVTGWVAGETLPHRIFRDGGPTDGARSLHRQAAEALARIHRIDPAGLDLPVVDALGPYRAVLDAAGAPYPALEWAYRWLVAHRPEPGRPTVVHGDFRLGNLMVGADGLAAVLDWELAHLGDAYEDVAWPLVRAWRFDAVRPPGAFPEREAWTRAYATATGRPVDEEALRWWEVAATFRWGVICITQWLRHRDGTAPSVELAAIGRRVVETEYDLLELLGDRRPVQPAAPGSAPGSPDNNGALPPPDAGTLLAAVRELLTGEVMAVTEGTVRHHVRVGAHVLDQLEREVRLGPGLAERHRARLAAVGAADDEDLAGAIRAGALDGREDVRRLLLEDAVDRLAVVNPAWVGATAGVGRSTAG